MDKGLDISLDSSVLEALQTRVPAAARRIVVALGEELPAYSRAQLGTEMATTIERSVELALAGFLRLAGDGLVADPAMPSPAVVDAAYQLGRGEARAGRPIEVLLAAYRIGARVAWQDLSDEMVERAVPLATLARFAALVFAYIDQLSAASVAGHNEEVATSARARERFLERLGRALLAGEPSAELRELAERADWTPPTWLTAVVLPSSQLRAALQVVAPGTLVVTSDVVPELPEGVGVLLVPDTERSRGRLLHALKGRRAVVGPARPWDEVRLSHERARRVAALPEAVVVANTVDTEDHLVALVLGADAGALADLRRRALEPLANLRPAAASRLAETLRSWLLHQGRREAVAADLHVHPQTVRYRMSQLRDIFGDGLTRSDTVLELLLALALPEQSPHHQ